MSIRGAVACAVCAACVTATVASSRASSQPLRVRTEVAPHELPVGLTQLLEAHCLDCHEGTRLKGELDLGAILARGSADAALLIELRARLVLRDMPPHDEPDRPSRAQYRTAIAAIDTLVKPQARTVAAVRRINRDQYLRSVRDVIGADSLDGVDILSLLPRDEVGEGFDTTGDTLALPALLMEKYFDSAEAIAARVITPASARRNTFVSAEKLTREGVGDTYDGTAWLATDGVIIAPCSIRTAGRYRVEVLACAQQAGSEVARMAIEIDFERVATHDVPHDAAAPGHFVWEGELAAGTRHIAVRFLNDFYDPTQEDPKRRDRNLGVSGVAIEGSLGAVVDSPFEQRMNATAGEGSTALRLRRVAASLGAQWFRRALTQAEVVALVSTARKAAGVIKGAPDEWERQLRALTTALLVDPRFLLRVERDTDEDSSRALSGDELASRLSYFLWSSVPDAALRRAAAAGELAQPTSLAEQTRRMLADPRSASLAERFATQWLGIDGLDEKQLDLKHYPAVDAAMLTSMQRETELLFLDIVRGDKPVRALLNARTTHVDARLAKHYGISNAPSEGFAECPLPDARAAGVLGHASVLVATSNPTRTSPVKRGKWVLQALIDAAPPPPPPGVAQLPESAAERRGLSIRELMRLHRENPDCASCHVRMDAIGLAFETLDADGGVRSLLDGLPIDDATEMPDGTVMRGVDGVRAFIEDGDAFERSLARHLLVYALGRGTAPADDALLDDLAQRLHERGDFASLVEAIVCSDAFRMRGSWVQ